MRTRFSNGTYHEPGIYFGMPFDEYIQDWSLGSSDLVNLLISPTNYWWSSKANPNREERKDTHALMYGRAIHKAVLEPHRFPDEYAPAPPEPEPGQIVSHEDLKAKCEELGLKKSGTKAELAERIRAAGDETPIYDEIVKKYKEVMGERTLLPHSVYKRVVDASEIIKKNYHIEGAFDGGYAEVSVFFEMHGIPMRARFDYLKPGCVVDLKSIRNHLRQEWPVAIANSIARHKYTVQATSYLQARNVVNTFIKEGRVFGDPLEMPNKDWLKATSEQDDFCFYWVFFQAEGAPLTSAVQFDHRNEEFVTAADQIEMASRIYKSYINKFDHDMWIMAHKPIQLANLTLPSWWNPVAYDDDGEEL